MKPNAMGNAELLQMMTEIKWAQNDSSDMFEKLAVLRIGYEVYQRLSGEREVDVLRDQTIAAIAKYIKENPNAKNEDIQKEVLKYICAFAEMVEKL